ncbi:MAG TPA: tail fiber domain-containing protein, partial [Candidatus Paceibacterota bacterium]
TPGGSSGQFQYNNAGSFAGAAMYYSGTNVGIGTASPGANKLSVFGGFAKFEYNSGASVWPATGNGLVIGWNHSGSHGESNFYNLYNGPGSNKAFTFTQMTGTNAGFEMLSLSKNGLAVFHGDDNGATAGGFSIATDKGIWSNGTVNVAGQDAAGLGIIATHDILSAGNMKAAAFIYNSDRRLKKNIQSLAGSLAKLMQLQGVTYNWIDPEKGASTQIGFIAQDVEKVVPEVVHTDPSTTLQSIDYARLAPVIVNAIKEQEAKIEAQQKEIDELKAQMQVLIER